jgi:hypothetical protein
VSDVTSIDVSGLLRRLHSFNYWRYNVTSNEYIYKDESFRQEYQIVISESYDGTTHSPVTISGVYSIPAALHSIKFPYFDYDTVKIKGIWLTSFDRIKVRPSDKLTLSYLIRTTGNMNFGFNFYDKNGSLLYSNAVGSSVLTDGDDVAHIHSGLAELKDYLGFSTSVFDNTAYYEIQPSGVPAKRINVIHEDPRFSGIRVHYLNEWGGVDSFVFNLANRRGVSIEKKKAKIPFIGSQLRPSTFGAVNNPYVVKYTDTLKLTSDFISDNDSNALIELFTSPIVSVETEQSLFFPSAKGNKIILPCEIDLNSYEIKQSNLEKLFNLELEVRISVDNTRQSL